jgi:hypothetical protein
MIGPTGATGRGPAMAAFCARNEFARTVVLEVTETGFTRAFTGRLTAGLCVALTFRCLRLSGGVPVKPVAAKRWIANRKAMARGTWDRDALIIGCCSSPDR